MLDSMLIQLFQSLRMLPRAQILPETPLDSLIAEHKLRSDATILLSRMGPSSTWRALWDKLHTTLEQLKYVGPLLIQTIPLCLVGPLLI